MTTIDFQEEQRISMWWVWLAVLVPAAIMANIFVEQIVFGRPHGEHPGPDWLLWVLTVFLCLCVPALLLILRLTVTVDGGGIHIRYYPFVRRTISFSDIRAFQARRYRPIREFGGWRSSVRGRSFGRTSCQYSGPSSRFGWSAAR